MKAIDYSYFVEKYISGEMTSKEKLWFEKELEGNDTLQREIELRRKTDQFLSRHDVINLRNKLVNIEKTRKEREAIKIAQRKVILRSAAVLACFLFIGSLYFILNKTSSPEKIFNKNFTAYNPGGNVRNSISLSTISNNISYKKALELYNQGDYSYAASLLKEHIIQQPNHMEAHLIYGVASMKNNDFEEAIRSFSIIINDGNNLYIDNARWYMALCYISLNNFEAAKYQLQVIKNSGSFYSARAEKILKRIK